MARRNGIRILRAATIATSVVLSTTQAPLCSPVRQKDGRKMQDCAKAVLTALSKVSEYDIYQTPVIVQQVYLGNRDLSVSLIPDEQDGANRTPTPKWRVSVIFPRDGRSPRVAVRNARKTTRPAGRTSVPTAGDAVSAASRHLHARGSALRTPFVVEATADSAGYLVTFTGLPEVPGGHTLVVVPPDLQKIRVLPGR